MALAFKIAAGLITFLALADGELATAAPPPVTVAFGAATGTPTSLGAAVYSVTVGGTAAAPTLTATILNSNPEPFSVPQPAVSSLAFFNNTVSGYEDLIASNVTPIAIDDGYIPIGDLYSLPGPTYSTPVDLFNSWANEGLGADAAGLGVDGGGNILGAGNYSYNGVCFCNSVFIYEQGHGVIPVLMDNVNSDTNLAGYSTIQTIADAAVSPGSFGNGIQAGDLITLVGDSYSAPGQAVVFVYPHTAVAQGLSSGFPVAGATALVTQSQFPISSGAVPVSIAISPIDGSLLVAVSDGTIWMIPAVQQTDSTPTGYGSPKIYANTGPYCGDGCSLAWGKIAAMQQSNSLYVFATVAQNAQTAALGQETGYFEVFSGPLPAGSPYYTAPSASVPTIEAVQPTSVAVLQQRYKMGSTMASNCYATNNPNGCDIIGDGTMKLTITGNTKNIPAGATITARECIATDPRPFDGTTTLALATVCPGLSDGTIIPGYLHGFAGPNGNQLIAIAASAEQVAEYSEGIEVKTVMTTSPELGSEPNCPQDRTAYGSLANSMYETQFTTGMMVFDATNACTTDPNPEKTGPHPSVHLVGLQTILTQFNGPVGLVDFKLNNLKQSIPEENIKYAWERDVLLIGTSIAQHLVNVGHYDCAAEVMYLLDRFVRRHAGDFLPSVPGAAVRVPNSFGLNTMWFGTTFFSLETDVQQRTPNTVWPLAADPHLCRTNECNVAGINN